MNRFKVFWFARTFSFYGDFIFSMTIIWFALKQGGAMEVAAISATSMIFRALGSFLMAPLINYMGSRVMIVMSDLLRAVLNILFWSLVFTHSSYAMITLAVNCANAFLAGGFDAGMQAFIPTISNQLRKANADLSRGRSIMQLLGFLTGGALLQWYFGVGFLVNAGTFAVGGIISFYIGGGEPSFSEKIVRKSLADIFRKSVENWKQSWQALHASPTLRLAFGTSIFMNLFIVPMLALMAPLVQETHGGGSMMFSVIQSASVIGSLIGASWARKSKIKDAYLMIIGSLICGVVGLIAASSSLAIMLAVAMLVFGFAQAIYNISESTAIQKNEAHLRASIYGILQMSVLIFYPVTALTAARLVESTSIRLPFLGGGCIVALATLYFAWRWYVAENNGNNNQEAEVPL